MTIWRLNSFFCLMSDFKENIKNFSNSNNNTIDSLIETKEDIEHTATIINGEFKNVKWWYRLSDPFIFLSVLLFVGAVKAYITLFYIYSLYIWPILKKISLLVRGNDKGFIFTKIPKHVAIYSSKTSPQKLHLRKVIKKCLEYDFGADMRIRFLTIIIDKEIENFHDYIVFDEGDLENISLYQDYKPVNVSTKKCELFVNFLKKDGCDHYLSIMKQLTPDQIPKTADRALALISDKFPVIDLLIVLNKQLIITGCMPFHIAFSEIAHFPCTKSDWCIELIFDEAVKGFAKCKQNFGK